jgi:hypothetical protein
VREELPWYGELRQKWRPNQVHLLLIAESAPADDGDESRRRFFYLDRLSGADNLFRGTVEALYGAAHLDSRTESKTPWLERLRADGVFLIDLVPYPINKLTSSEKRAAQRASVEDAVDRARALSPEGIIVIKKDVFALLDKPLRRAGLPLLHDEGISFPLGNTRAEFVRDVRAARGRLGHPEK